jgi:methylmalonyl-CoA carboxyltransferase small subunit
MKLKVTVNGTAYDVDVEVEEEPRPTLASLVFGNGHTINTPAAPANASVPASAESGLKAPISGTVTKVLAESGTAVEAGAVLLILEAMKMETEITAPAPGTVDKILVEPGDAVSGGQTVLTWA